MHAVGAYVAALKSVVVMEYVLNAKIPGDGLRPGLVRDIAARFGDGLRRGQRSAAGTRQDAPVGQEAALILPGYIYGVVGLRWKRKQPLIVIEHVVKHTEAGANRGLAAGARRVGDTDAGHDRILLRLRLAEGDQARDVGNGILRLQPFTVGNRLVFVSRAQA